MEAIIIKRDKTVIETTDTAYENLSAVVEGLIEGVYLSSGDCMYVNEEYRLGQFGPEDVNWLASDVAGLGGRQDLLFNPILGDVIIVGPTDREGENLDITPEGRRLVQRVAREA